MDYYTHRTTYSPLHVDSDYVSSTSRSRASHVASSVLDDNDQISRRSRLNDARAMDTISHTMLDSTEEELGSPRVSSYLSKYKSYNDRDLDILSRGRALLAETIPSPRFKRHEIRKQFTEYTPRLDYSYQPTTRLSGPVYYGRQFSPEPTKPPCLDTGSRSEEYVTTRPSYLDDEEDEVFVPSRKRIVHAPHSDSEEPEHEHDDPVCLGRYSERHVDNPDAIESGSVHSRASEITRRYREKEGLYGEVDYTTDMYPRYFSSSTVPKIELDDDYIPRRYGRSTSTLESRFRRSTGRGDWGDELDALTYRRRHLEDLDNDEPVSVLDRIKVKSGKYLEMMNTVGTVGKDCDLLVTTYERIMVKAKLLEKTLPPTTRRPRRHYMIHSEPSKYPPEFECSHGGMHTSHDACLRHVEWHDGQKTGHRDFHTSPMIVSIKDAHVDAVEDEKARDPDLYVFKPESRRESEVTVLTGEFKASDAKATLEIVPEATPGSSTFVEESIDLEPAYQTECMQPEADVERSPEPIVAAKEVEEKEEKKEKKEKKDDKDDKKEKKEKKEKSEKKEKKEKSEKKEKKEKSEKSEKDKSEKKEKKEKKEKEEK